LRIQQDIQQEKIEAAVATKMAGKDKYLQIKLFIRIAIFEMISADAVLQLNSSLTRRPNSTGSSPPSELSPTSSENQRTTVRADLIVNLFIRF
jgi:hypothetical protein